MSNLTAALENLGLSTKDFENFQKKAKSSSIKEGQIGTTKDDLEEEISELNSVSAFYPQDDENEVDMGVIFPYNASSYCIIYHEY